MSRLLEQYQAGFNQLQTTFDNRIAVAPRTVNAGQLALSQLEANKQDGEKRWGPGFVDIAASTDDLEPLLGRIILLPNLKTNLLNPAVMTKRNGVTTVTKLDVAFDPNVGISDGLRFALGLKADTDDKSFGSHGPAGAYEAGHFSPVMLGAGNSEVGQEIIAGGDHATHGIVNAGVPEQMAAGGVLPAKYQTKRLPSGVIVPLVWHQSLESSQHGLMTAEYPDAIKLMLGAATLKLGDAAIDRVGNLVEHAIKGAA